MLDRRSSTLARGDDAEPAGFMVAWSRLLLLESLRRGGGGGGMPCL